MANAQALEYLNSLKGRRAELTADVNQLLEHYRAKLWHQLTVKLEQIIEQPQWKDELPSLYPGFIGHFESKLNQLSLVKIAVAISKSLDAAAATEFLTKLAGKTTDSNAVTQEAHLLAVSEVALLKLRSGKLDECKAQLAEAKKLLDNLTGVDSAVYAAFYFASAEYSKRKSTAAEFYKNALLFLAYANVDKIPAEERKVFAFDLVVSALVGENVYSFGELISQPIIAVLAVDATKWLLDILSVFNHGDIAKWKTLAAEHGPKLAAVPAIAQHAQTLTEKITILAMIELVFSLPSDKRTVPFATLAQVSQVPLGEVEFVVMKGLSLGLVKGTIDQVQQTVTITWVQPRVLSMQQIAGMQQRLGKWSEGVRGTLLFMEGETPELFA